MASASTMTTIGKGWQYIVYDLQNGRVKKQTHSTLIQYLYILFNNVFVRWNVFAESWKQMQRVRKMEKASNEYIQSILPIFDTKLLGNPVFCDNGYEQDKGVILGEILKNCSIGEGKKIFAAYVHLIQTTWCYGFADTVFNFAVNNSLSTESKIVQLDFGELIFNKADVEQCIKCKCWLHSASYTSFPEGELKNYYHDLMEQKITLKNLDKFWGTKLKS